MVALEIVLWTAAVLLAAATLASMFSSRWWLFDLASHLPVQLALASTLVGVIALAVGAPLPGPATLALATALINVIIVLPQLDRRRPPTGPTRHRRDERLVTGRRPLRGQPDSRERGKRNAGDRWDGRAPTSRRDLEAAVRPDIDDGAPRHRVRMLFANVSERNHDLDRMIEAIALSDADVAVLAEVDADAMAQLRLRLPAYRHHHECTIGPRPLGMGVLSRHRLSSPRIVTLDEGSAPGILAHVEDLARPLSIIGAHPLPPYRPTWYARRNRYLDRLAELVERQEGEAVVVGDFNITPWAGHYRRFVERTDLEDSRSGFGLHTTWPSFLPALLRIPIDHCFVTRGVNVVDRRVLESTGSDHLPIVIDLEL